MLLFSFIPFIVIYYSHSHFIPVIIYVLFPFLIPMVYFISGLRIQGSASIIQDSQFIMQDPEFKIRSAGFRIQDPGSIIQDLECVIQNPGSRSRIHAAESRIQKDDPEFKTPDPELGTQNPQSQIQIPGPESPRIQTPENSYRGSGKGISLLSSTSENRYKRFFCGNGFYQL